MSTHPKSDPDIPFPSHRTCSVHTEQQTDEKSARIEKKHMEIDQNDQDPPNRISKLSKAIDDVHASKSDVANPGFCQYKEKSSLFNTRYFVK